jgi:FkbM family methyltransferase
LLFASDHIIWKWLLQLFWKPSPREPEFYIHQYLANQKEVYFIQVGANDGLVRDPLIHLITLHKNWKGVLLEPLPDVYNRELKPLHRKRPRLLLINAALASEVKHAVIYRIAFSKKRWATGLTTFRKETLLSKINDGYVERCARKYGDTLPANRNQWITEQTIRCITFEQILTESGFPRIDLLQIDAEGFDLEIIRMIPFHLIKPYVISFEHEHLSMDDKATCFELLQKQGYQLIVLQRDTVARLTQRN